MININENGIVTVWVSTGERGYELEILPGDAETAAQYLSADELTQVTAIWTPEIIAAIAANPPEVAVAPNPTTSERLDALEARVAELEAAS